MKNAQTLYHSDIVLTKGIDKQWSRDRATSLPLEHVCLDIQERQSLSFFSSAPFQEYTGAALNMTRQRKVRAVDKDEEAWLSETTLLNVLFRKDKSKVLTKKDRPPCFSQKRRNCILSCWL